MIKGIIGKTGLKKERYTFTALYIEVERSLITATAGE
jgi:hypothetical protein